MLYLDSYVVSVHVVVHFGVEYRGRESHGTTPGGGATEQEVNHVEEEK